MHKRLQDFLQNPSTMAHAGYWAMLFKACIGLLMGIVFSILVKKNFCLGILYLSYPIIAVIVDLLLYQSKDKIWSPLPANTIVPREWKITAPELVQYAKELPKIRLRRLRFIPALMLSLYILFFLVADEKIEAKLFTIGMLWSNAHICFFLSVLFEPELCKKLHLKKPNLIRVKHLQTSHHRIILDPTAHSCIIHPYHYHSESIPTVSRLHDWASINQNNRHNPHIPATPAWIIAQHQYATHRSFMELDRMASMAHATNPAHSLHSTTHDDYHRTTHLTSSSMDPLTGINHSSHTTSSFNTQPYSSTLNDWNNTSMVSNHNTNFSQSFTSTSNTYESSSTINSFSNNPFSSNGSYF